MRAHYSTRGPLDEGTGRRCYPLPGFSVTSISTSSQLHQCSPKLSYPGRCLSAPLSRTWNQSHPALTDVVFGDFVHRWPPISAPGALTCITSYVQRAYMHKRSAHNPVLCDAAGTSPLSFSPLLLYHSTVCMHHRRLHHQPHSSHWIDVSKNAHLRFPLPGPARPTPADVKTIPAH
jgi:hypothetical protein